MGCIKMVGTGAGYMRLGYLWGYEGWRGVWQSYVTQLCCSRTRLLTVERSDGGDSTKRCSSINV